MPYTEGGREAWMKKPSTQIIGEWGYSKTPNGGYTFWKTGNHLKGRHVISEERLRER